MARKYQYLGFHFDSRFEHKITRDSLSILNQEITEAFMMTIHLLLSIFPLRL